MQKSRKRSVDPAHAPGKRGLGRPRENDPLVLALGRKGGRAWGPGRALAARPRRSARHS